jgi:hypothetical protein
MIKKVVGVIMISFLLSPLFMYLVWVFTPERNLNVLIFDKTVLETKAQEHRSISWILTNEKYKHSLTGLYEHDIDYFGFFPNDSGKYKIKDFNNYSTKSLDSLANLYDITYYTDLYGIYKGEWYNRYPNVASEAITVDNSMEHTDKIYGGMTAKELLFLQKMKLRRKLVICEFNVIATPTPVPIRQAFENEFKMIWTGWIGRYYETLDTLKNKELPRWLKSNYLAQHKNSWPFHQSGIVFVKDNDRIEILENNTHLVIEIPMIHTNAVYMRKYDLPAEMKYSFWFEIIRTSSENKVVSTYKITPNNYGRKLLRGFGIPENFPAVIEHDSTDYKFLYFAGDFCDNSIGMKSAKFKWIDKFNAFAYKRSTEERVSFFWDYYRPMVDKVLLNYYNRIN